MGTYRLFTVSRNPQHTSVQFNIETNVIPTQANEKIYSGNAQSSLWGYNSAVYYVAGSSIAVFLVLQDSTHVDLYSGGLIPTSAYDNENGYSGFSFNASLGSNAVYEEDFGYMPVFNNYQDFLTYVQTPQVTYNWQSVPSISGKNGILSLAQIKEEYINDGESVSGASADHFISLSTENRIDILIDAALPDPEIGGTTVTVKYTISSLSIGSYAYCKLVAKKNSIPESVEDGDKIVEIDPSLTSIAVTGLDELSTYYFVIFIEDDQGNTAISEPQDCMTGEMQEVTLADIAKTLNTDYMQLYINNQWWDSYQNAFAQYFGTNNILQAVRNGGSRIALYDGENLNTNDKWGVSETRIWIPIERTTISKITVTGYTTYQGNYRSGYIQLCKIESGALVETGHIIQLPWQGSQDSKTVSYEFETPFEADYISLEAGDGVIYLHDIIFNGE